MVKYGKYGGPGFRTALARTLLAMTTAPAPPPPPPVNADTLGRSGGLVVKRTRHAKSRSSKSRGRS